MSTQEEVEEEEEEEEEEGLAQQFRAAIIQETAAAAAAAAAAGDEDEEEEAADDVVVVRRLQKILSQNSAAPIPDKTLRYALFLAAKQGRSVEACRLLWTRISPSGKQRYLVESNVVSATASPENNRTRRYPLVCCKDGDVGGKRGCVRSDEWRLLLSLLHVHLYVLNGSSLSLSFVLFRLFFFFTSTSQLKKVILKF
jgi:hypothetical protein